MKTLMFAVAAVTAGIAVADVTSANIVGYVNPQTEETLFIGTPLVKVGGVETGLTLKDIVVNCDEAGDGDGTGWQPFFDTINLLTSDGSFSMSLVYVPQWYAEIMTIEKGWYDAECAVSGEYTSEFCYNNRDELKIEAGKGFQVTASEGVGATVTIKSALATDDDK